VLKVSVIIPTYRSWDYLSKCLEALDMQSLPKEEFEVLVINNDPSDTKPEDILPPINAKLYFEKDPGSYCARNLGIELAQSEIFAFTDADCIPGPNWLENGIKHLANGADMVGGRVDFFKEEGGDELTYLFEKTFNFNQKRNVEERGQSITANLFCKKNVVEKIGPFKTKLLSGGDFEWSSRATSSGFKMVYGNDTLVHHPARKEFKSLVSKKRRTSGGMYYRFFQGFTNWEKLKFTMNILRPRISLLFRKDIGLNDRIRLFFAVWYLEWIGVKEMYLLAHQGKAAQRH
jgi:GT2 family glycosyltransferase